MMEYMASLDMDSIIQQHTNNSHQTQPVAPPLPASGGSAAPTTNLWSSQPQAHQPLRPLQQHSVNVVQPQQYQQQRQQQRQPFKPPTASSQPPASKLANPYGGDGGGGGVGGSGGGAVVAERLSQHSQGSVEREDDGPAGMDVGEGEGGMAGSDGGARRRAPGPWAALDGPGSGAGGGGRVARARPSARPPPERRTAARARRARAGRYRTVTVY